MRGVDGVVELLVGRGDADPEVGVADVRQEVERLLEVSESLDRLPQR